MDFVSEEPVLLCGDLREGGFQQAQATSSIAIEGPTTRYYAPADTYASQSSPYPEPYAIPYNTQPPSIPTYSIPNLLEQRLHALEDSLQIGQVIENLALELHQLRVDSQTGLQNMEIRCMQALRESENMHAQRIEEL